jgi:hypothetical protein
MALCHRSVLRRHWWCCSCQICVARLPWQSCSTLCSDSARRLWKRCCVRGRINDLFLSDDHGVVRNQSQTAGALYGLFCRRTTRDVLHIRSAAVRDEHESGANSWLSNSRQLLARTVDLFHSSVAWHAGGWRVISSSARERSLLRQTSPRQSRTLHLPSCPRRSLERRILCHDFKITTSRTTVA